MTLYCLHTAYIERCVTCNSSLYVSPAKGVVSVMAARVQIPASPLETHGKQTFRGFFYSISGLLQIVVNCEKLQRTVYITAYIFFFVLLTTGSRFFTIFWQIHTTPLAGV